jgi:2-amino-4-hydroxy-6-hydroxymethyldihydropteridine diphosphokinase
VTGSVPERQTGSVPERRARAYLGLGSNVGDRLAHLQGAVDGLGATPGVDVVAVSPVYETAPVGGPPQDDYLNAVVAVESDLDARALLRVAQDLEARAGRVRAERWGPRTLDVDVLLVGDVAVDEEDLVVPHPRMRERAFVLAPLADLDPTWTDAVPRDGTGVRRTGVALRLPE